MNYTLIFFLTLGLLVPGCSNNTLKPDNDLMQVDIATDINLKLLPPLRLSHPVHLTQNIIINYMGEQHQLICKIEMKNNSFKMVAFSSIGLKLFSIQSNGYSYITDVTPMLDKQLNIMYLLADIQLTYWPVEQLNARLKASNANIRPNSLNRKIFKAGNEIINIQYSSNSLWNKNVTFKHLSRGYTVQINTLEASTL